MVEPDNRRRLGDQGLSLGVAGLEHRGYIERHTGPSPAARVVRMTDQGWAMVAPIRDCVAAIEQEWTAHLGARRFKALRETLRELSLWLGKLD